MLITARCKQWQQADWAHVSRTDAWGISTSANMIPKVPTAATSETFSPTWCNDAWLLRSCDKATLWLSGGVLPL